MAASYAVEEICSFCL